MASIAGVSEARTVVAHVVAIDQQYDYNRFGSFNPVGMIYALRRDVVNKVTGLSEAEGGVLAPGAVMLRQDKRPRPLVLRSNVGDTLEVHFTNLLGTDRPSGPPESEPPEPGAGGDAPATRDASIAAVGLTPDGDNHNCVNTGLCGLAPGDSYTYSWTLVREGAHLFSSLSAPAGGEGDGGSIVQGLFGVINVEPAGTAWYRSQVTADQLAAATEKDAAGDPMALPTGHPKLDYAAVDADGQPILGILNSANEIVHGDLNAIIVGPHAGWDPDDDIESTTEGNFREFTVVFHDEIKAVQAYDLLNEEQMTGVRDGFAINYGSSGLGAMLVANRLGEGPAKECPECAYEEFFLTSWVNGDPALLSQYGDDPSNVHHSYLSDRVIFRNLHAGPKETHVFHLHAHQWLGDQGDSNSTYLDPQTLAPMQAFNYEIQYGGSGNRNLTPGDSIFHCHLYPHFAEGMWELWRVHDVFEDGNRRLPDGEAGPGTDPVAGTTNGGTPIPAIVPLPQLALPPLPTYVATVGNEDSVIDAGEVPMPGYPFYIAGRVGHRPPQAPLDLADDGGMPRNVVLSGTRTTHEDLENGDFSVELETLNLEILPHDGTPLEKAAMAFHGTMGAGGYSTLTPSGDPAIFNVNGLPPSAGAPFAEPCDPALVTGTRVYNVSAIQLDLEINAAGWHNPQSRINVLDSDVARYEGKTTTADPFFFRANSGECIEFRHTNRLPKELDVDDFQVQTPTDTIGQHIHLVKFDVTSSDGSANGWNYEDGTFSLESIDERLEAVHRNGGSAVDITGVPVSLPQTGSYQTTVQRWWADPLLNQMGDDRTIRTVFTHDHFAPSTIQHYGFYNALVIEPAGSQWVTPDGSDDKSVPLDPARGVGTNFMIVNADDPDTHPDHREFMLAVADFAVAYDPTQPGSRCPDAIGPKQGKGCPVNAPQHEDGTPAPEAISTEDPGTFVVNYKNEPIPLRVGQFDNDGTFIGLKPGAAGDMAHVFDSSIHGDPFTEMFRAYEGDRVVMRMIQGAQEEQHVFRLNGARWKREQSNENSAFVSAQPIGISEHFEYQLDDLANISRGAEVADYLYQYAATDNLWNGTWGMLRSYNDVNAVDPTTGQRIGDTLAPLGDNQGRVRRTPSAMGFNSNGCPSDAPLKTFNVEAWAARDLLPGGELVYNAREGITDPSGLLFIHARDRTALMNGNKQPEPLVLRANAGDCIRVVLRNRLPINVPDHLGDAILPPITNMRSDDFRPSNSVGLNPQLVSYDIRTSDGANVGYNRKQTAEPGRAVSYHWYAGTVEVVPDPGAIGFDKRTKVATPREFGAISLAPFGDVIKHGVQGLIGMLIIEPEGASYEDPLTGASLIGGTSAVIRHQEDGVEKTFREFVVLYQGGMNLLEEGAEMPSNFIADDAEDDGERGLNYRTEPFCARLGLPGDCDSNDTVYPVDFLTGDIETPVFQANTGDEVRFRVGYPSGPARQSTFMVYGHDYPDQRQPTGFASGQSLVAPGVQVTATPYGGAQNGTWVYRPGPTFQFASGVWGRFEVDSPSAASQASAPAEPLPPPTRGRTRRAR